MKDETRLMASLVLTQAARSLGLLAAIGASLAMAVWSLAAGPSLTQYVTHNQIDPAARVGLAWLLFAGALAGTCGGVALAVASRGRDLAVTERFARRLAPLALAGLLPLLLRVEIWKQRELEFVVLAAVFGLSALGLARLSLATPPAFPVVGERLAPLRARVARLGQTHAPLVVVLVAAAGYATLFSVYTVLNHLALRTSSFDLGVENNLLWNLIHGAPLFRTTPHGGGPLGSHLGFHHTYFSFLLAPLYALAPRPETLLVLQSVFVGAAALPLYLLGRRHVGPWSACVLALAYLLYAPVHGANLYEFHYLPLAPFFLWFTLHFAESGRTLPALAIALVTISIREDVAGCVGLLGAYLVLTGIRPRLGSLIGGIGLLHFVVIKMFVMPAVLAGQSSYVNQYRDLLPPGMSGFGGVLLTVFGNPGFTLHTLLEREKLVYLLMIMAPLVFLPWRRPAGLLLSLPGFFFTLLATRYPPMTQISFQYTAFWTMFSFIAVVHHLGWLGRPRGSDDAAGPVRRRAWLLALIAATLVTSHQHGAIFQHETARAGFDRFLFGISDQERARHDALYVLIAQVPPDARIASSEQIVPHVSSRAYSYSLRAGIFDADWLLFPVPSRPDEREMIDHALRSGSFGVVAESDGFVLARRGFSPASNAGVRRRL